MLLLRLSLKDFAFVANTQGEHFVGSFSTVAVLLALAAGCAMNIVTIHVVMGTYVGPTSMTPHDRFDLSCSVIDT